MTLIRVRDGKIAEALAYAKTPPRTTLGQTLELVESRATPRGVTIQVYRPTGRLQVGTSTADLKHVK